MIAFKASQKNLHLRRGHKPYGICAEHLENLARRHRLGFIARATGTQRYRTGGGSSHVGPNGFSDAVPTLCALRSRAPCFIGGSLSSSTD
jgi:hypothetical protein